MQLMKNRTVEERESFRRGNRYFWLGFLAPVIIALIGYIQIKVWPFGDGTVLIIDSIHQYLPFYTEFHEKLRTGQSLFYDFSAGMGYNFWSTYAYYLASPLNFLIALVPKANVCDFMDYLIIFKIGLCGGTFSWYLSRRNKEAKFLPVVFAAMFAMSNFTLGYYFNLMWLDSIAMLPLIMYGIEKIAKGGRGILYGASLFLGLWCNYYIGFMLCIFSVLYYLAVTVICQWTGMRALIRKSIKYAWYSLLAGGMSAMVLLPAFMGLTSSEAVENNKFPSVIKFYTDFVDMLSAQFVSMHPINISSTQVGLNTYCGVAVMILVLLYLLDTRIKLRERLTHLALAAILMLSFAMNILNYIWHGFHQQNGLPNRFAFIYICVILIMSYDALTHIQGIELWKIIVSGIIPIVSSIYIIQTRSGDWDYNGKWIYLTPVLLAVYLLLMLAGRIANLSNAVCGIMVGVLLLGEAAGHGVYGYIYDENVPRKTYLNDQASYQTLMAPYLSDDEFYRSEIDAQRMRNVSMFAGADSIIMFNSTMLASVTHFCDKIGMEARTNKNGYNGVTTLMNAVLGEKYVLSSNGKGDTLYQFEKIDSDEHLTLYGWDNNLSIGFMVNPEIRYWDIDEGNTPVDVQNSFVKLATGLDSIFTLDRTVDAKSGEKNEVKVPEGKQVYLYVPNHVKSFQVNTPEYSKTFTTYTDHLYPMNSLGDSDIGSFTATSESGTGQTVYVYTCPDDKTQEVIDTLARNQLENVKVSGNTLEGSVHADEAGILLLTIPNEDGWQITADGEKVSALTIGGALTGIELSAGDHEIKMKYIPKGFYQGMLLTLISMLLFAASILYEKREAEKQMKLKFSNKAMSFRPGIFAQLNEKKEQLQQAGKTIYNLSVGTPDFKTPQHIMDAVCEAASKPENYRYSLKDIPELVEALQAFYQRRFGVRLEADEITSVYGSQEGMAHLSWALCDPGDLVLVPNPGYPVFKIGPQLCDARVWEYPLLEENDFLPDLDAIPEEVCSEAKFMIVSYPNNPVCRCAPDEFYDKLIDWAKKNDIIIIHDNAYADIVYGGRTGKSFLAFEGAKEIGAEFYSLSKTFDYTGARMSFLVGNRDIIRHFSTIRSQIDYGAFLPVQYGAIAALNEPDNDKKAQCAMYEERNHALCQGLRDIGWDVPDSEGSMFVWAHLPAGYTDSDKFVMELMEKTGVICTPGSSFGSLGREYVRFALVLPPEKLKEAVEAIERSGILSEGAARS